MVLRRKCEKDLKWALPVLIRTPSRTAIRQNELGKETQPPAFADVFVRKWT